jgi:hypothetical protein
MHLPLRVDGFTQAVQKRNIPTAGTSRPDCGSFRSRKARSHSCDATVAARGYIAIPIPPWASVVCPLADANGYMLASLRDGTTLVPANAGRGTRETAPATVRVKPQKAMPSRSHTVFDTKGEKSTCMAVQFRMHTGTGHLTTVAALEQQLLLHQHIPGRGWAGETMAKWKIRVVFA